MTPHTLHQRLREATRAAHEDLETAVAIERQFASRKDYAGYLLRLLRAHEEAEFALQQFDLGVFGLVYGERRKSELLNADLRYMGVEVTAGHQNHAPLVFRSFDEALGCVYVIEGSSLGARAVLPQIKRMLGFDERAGASYFGGLGEEGKMVWRAILKAIDGIPPGSAEADSVVSGARATFAMFRERLPGPPEVSTSVGVAPA